MEAAKCTRPDYPNAARRVEATGTSKIRFQIDPAGRVVNAEVLRSAGPSREHRMLDRAAVQSLSQCAFQGGLDSRGRPKGGFATVEYVWKLE